MEKPSILIIKMGTTYRELKSRSGDFDKWIIQATEKKNVRWKTKPFTQIVPENLAKFDGIILTGAHSSMVQGFKWLDGMKRVVGSIIESEIPTLGICFSHQLINKILGGEVITNPLGIAIGVTEIQLTLDGIVSPIFNEVNKGKIDVYSVHTDSVVKIGDGVVSLAWNEHNQYQATMYKDFIYTIQFHPEFNKEIMEFYIRKNWDLIKSNYLPALQEQAGLKGTLNYSNPESVLNKNKQLLKSRRILNNFVQIVAESK
jgi:GMP synthase (glutamine-hydrolysing)